jgi:hypothetical protein
MHATRIFEGPSSTTFFFEGDDLLIVNAEGEEARLDRQKLQGFLLYLAERAIALQAELPTAGPSKPPELIPTVTLGDCSLIFEVDAVLVLGIEGTAAWVPFKDLRAVIKHLMTRSSISDVPD